MGSKAAEIPWWVNQGNPGEMKAWRAGVLAGRAGKEMPQGGKFYVVMYAGWVQGNEARARKGQGR